jgi:hypothetical protein
MVDKHILAARPLDEAIALGGIKPLHNTLLSHYLISFESPNPAWITCKVRSTLGYNMTRVR